MKKRSKRQKKGMINGPQSMGMVCNPGEGIEIIG
jgi:hypothetical protein